MKPHDMGLLFDECADRGTATVTHLDRPFDIAPDGGVRYDVAALAGLVREAAGWLAAAGVRAGDRIAVLKDNHFDYDLLACAAVRLGAVPALIAAHLTADVVGVLLKRLDPALLVTTGALLAAARADGTDLAGLARRTLCLDRAGGDAGAGGVLGMDDVRGHRSPGPVRRHDDAPLVINHTSGTTGVPKLVIHSTRTLVLRLAGLESIRWPLLGVRPDDVVASASSFAHGRTFCWTASMYCLAPQEIVVVSDIDPERAGPVLAAHRPTTLEALPSAFVRWRPLAAQPNNPFHRVRLYVSTYDAMHPPTVRTFLHASRRRAPVWMQGWGQTETGPLTFRFLTRRALRARRQRHPTTRNLGRPVPLRTRLRVVDPQTFRPVPPGRAGLVLASTRARCLGYVGEQERWSDKAAGQWWNTGDIGALTRSGCLLLLDREVDAVAGMSCVELEDVIEDRLPEVIECVVLGVRDGLPLPVVVTAGGGLDRAAWDRAVADLPTLADPVPLAWDDVPRTGTGKVRRLDLLHRLAAGADAPGSGRWT